MCDEYVQETSCLNKLLVESAEYVRVMLEFWKGHRVGLSFAFSHENPFFLSKVIFIFFQDCVKEIFDFKGLVVMMKKNVCHQSSFCCSSFTECAKLARLRKVCTFYGFQG